MVANTFSHPPPSSYDYGVHVESFRENQYLLQPIPQKLKGQIEYNPPLYYYIIGKSNHIIEEITRKIIDPFYLARIIHIAIYISVVLMCVNLIPLVTKDKSVNSWSVVALLTIPNIYLSQVMARADLLLLLFLTTLVYVWFKFDFSRTMPQSKMKILIWAVCLIGMANSRNFAIFAFIIFFVWGATILIKSNLRKLFVVLLLIFIILGSGYFYAERFIETGRILDQALEMPYFQKYENLQKNFDRRKLFFNVQFNKLFETPNRFASFEENNSFAPRFYGDMWGDHWLYFSGLPLKDNKVVFKRIILIAAIPFTLLYLFSPILYLFKSIKAFIKDRKFTLDNLAPTLFCTSLLLLTLFIYRQPEVGKNSTIKFTYLIAFFWLPIFSMAKFLSNNPKIRKLFIYYNYVLYIISIPLYIYWK